MNGVCLSAFCCQGDKDAAPLLIFTRPVGFFFFFFPIFIFGYPFRYFIDFHLKKTISFTILFQYHSHSSSWI